jgi:hypothetical protein
MNIIKNHMLAFVAATSLLATTSLSWADNRAGEIVITDLQSEKEFFDAMPVTGKVKTFFGDFDMEHSVPTEETTERIYELINHQRAAQLYLWSLPIVASERLIQGYFEHYDGYEYNTFVRIESFNERRGYLTANETTNYALGPFNTNGAAVVLEVPPGVVIGMIDDVWQESPSDIGIFGPNKGRGGTHVIIGPNTPQHMQPDPHELGDDFNIVNINTNRGIVLARVSGGTIEETLKTWDKMRMYNYGSEPTIRVIGGEDKSTQSIQPRGMAYWKLLHAAINNEVVAERDRLFMYWLRTLGIERGKPFEPNEKQTRALLDGVKVGEMMAKSFVFSERLDGVLREYDWRYVLGGEWGDGIKFNQSMRDYDIFDPRARYTYEAMTTSPSMTVPRPGGAQGYVAKFEDSDGERLKGEERYVMEFDSQPPQEMFWSLTIYDPDTRVLLDNRDLEDGSDVTVDSMNNKPKLNADGSFVVMLGPDAAPEGWASNYVRTLPGRGWFPYIRAYGAKKEFFDGTYQLPNIHRVENFDKWIK